MLFLYFQDRIPDRNAGAPANYAMGELHAPDCSALAMTRESI